ncbi:FkbM family methyltransferase [Lujinxingia vulgaris]|uniref:FkbM family methyltransferase n=1 Tax=Lujinxingia vulgaris TaxID=2600176 RepID=A0A5C6XE24_9DELT|nr:FkbM family methyltransferase [Lujinxingia vulgaris]TXD41660.1 FkbM family methyltransferase [Lujinxingia vulgaris]
MSIAIEFIGLPGAGKSTCVAHVIEALRAEGIAVRDRQEARERISAQHRQTPTAARALGLLSHLALRPTPWLLGLRLTTAMGPPHALGLRRLYDLSRKSHNTTLSRPSLKRASADPALTIFDQDIAQEIWSVLNLRELPDTRPLDALVQSLSPYLPDIVLFLNLPPAEALHRSEERARTGGHSVNFGLPSPPTSHDYDRGHRNFEALTLALSRCGVRCVTLDACPDPEIIADQALGHIRAFLQNSPDPRPADDVSMKSLLIRKLRRASNQLYQQRGLARLSDAARRLAARFPLQVDLDDFDGDLHFRLDLNEHMGSQIFWRGFYSGPQIALLRHLLEPDHVFIDIGANHGEFSVVAARQVPRGRVVAFEPNEAIHRRLRFNIESNGFENVTLSTSGLSDEPGVARIYQAAERFDDGTTHLGLATLYPTERRGQVVQEIELTTLDTFVKDAGLKRVDLIKIDIEGAELAALKGADEVLTGFRPNIILELNQGTCKSAGYTMDDLLDLLASYGYTFFEIAADGQTFALKALDRRRLKSFQNIVCVRPARAEEA